jgi:hypothetical protein
MRFRNALKIGTLAVLLSGCMAPLLLMPSSQQIMRALLTPLIGFDPSAVNLFEQPIIKERMTALLGTHYGTVMQLIETADKLEREGPLFFVISRYTPIPELAEKAGLVWNADTNQMAIAVLQGNGVEVFSEVIEKAVNAEIENIELDAEKAVGAAVQGAVEDAAQVLLPSWPTAMHSWFPAP